MAKTDKGIKQVKVTKAPKVAKAPPKARDVTKGGPRVRPTIGVELVTERPADGHGWRSLASGKTRSLSISLQPEVLDVFTSPKDAPEDRRNVFFVGESMQWNVVHHVDPFLKNAPYVVTVLLEQIGLASFMDVDGASHFESVYPIRTQLSAPQKYLFQDSLDSWFFDAVPAFVDTISGNRQQVLDGITAGGFGVVAMPGVWRMSAIVTIKSKVARAYDMQSYVWDYEIVGEPRPND